MHIVINHFTRMQPGSPYVCVAGVSGTTHIRPVVSNGRLDRTLRRSQGGNFSLGAEVELGPTTLCPVVPQVEDVQFLPEQASHRRNLSDDEFLVILDSVAKQSLRDVFGPDLEPLSRTAAAVHKNAGEASLGILKLGFDASIWIDENWQKPKIRFSIEDPEFGELSPTVTDIRLWKADQATPSAENIRKIEGRLEGCYVAVGLTRAFSVPSYKGVWHWLQVNNIFPADDPLWLRD